MGCSESARRRPATPAISTPISSRAGKGSTSVRPAVQRFAEVISRARTLVWNGPMGVFEDTGSPRGPEPSPKQWPPAGGSPWWAEARPRRHCTSSDWKTASITSPRAGAPHSSCSRRGIFPVSPPFARASPSLASDTGPSRDAPLARSSLTLGGTSVVQFHCVLVTHAGQMSCRCVFVASSSRARSAGSTTSGDKPRSNCENCVSKNGAPSNPKVPRHSAAAGIDATPVKWNYRASEPRSARHQCGGPLQRESP